MKRKNIIALPAAIALAFAITMPAEAQLGNVLDRAKKRVENKVKNKVESSVDKAVDKSMNKAEDTATKAAKKGTKKVGEQTGLPVPEVSSSESDGSGDGSSLYTLYKKDYKPSKEAIAAFPEAVGDEVYKGCSRSVSLRHGAYEHLDPKYFPLQPYYKYPMLYGLGFENAARATGMLSGAIRMRFANGYKTQNIIPPFVYDEKEYPELLTPAGEKMGVYADEPFRNSYAASFFADPNCEISVRRLASLLAYLGTHVQSGFSCEQADDDFNGILDAKQGIVLPVANFKHLRFEREQMMIDMACRVVDFDLIANRVIENFEKVIENDAFCQKDPALRVEYLLGAYEMYQKVLVKHNDWKSKKDTDPKARRATMLFTRFNQTPEMLEILQAVRAGNIPAVSMPKGVSVPADVKAKGDAAGRELAQHRGDEFVKVVYLENQWRAFKQPEWPYKVRHYAIKADLITKSGGKTVLTHCALQKSVDGQKYVMVVGSDSEKHPVK